MIIEIQCLPKPSGTPEVHYAHVHAAIEVIEHSGLAYEVGALGTCVEGPPERLWPLVQAVHDATFTAGATSCLTVLKIFDDRDPEAPTMHGLTDRYR